VERPTELHLAHPSDHTARILPTSFPAVSHIYDDGSNGTRISPSHPPPHHSPHFPDNSSSFHRHHIPPYPASTRTPYDAPTALQSPKPPPSAPPPHQQLRLTTSPHSRFPHLICALLHPFKWLCIRYLGITAPQSSAEHFTVSSSSIYQVSCVPLRLVGVPQLTTRTSCSVSRRLWSESADRSIGQDGFRWSARVMHSRQKVCLHEVVVTGSTRAELWSHRSVIR
jgi:hypothetical protein